MIAVAEESNTLDTVLNEIADGLERHTWRQLDLMVRLLEPLMLLVLAGGYFGRGDCAAVAGAQDGNDDLSTMGNTISWEECEYRNRNCISAGTNEFNRREQ